MNKAMSPRPRTIRTILCLKLFIVNIKQLSLPHQKTNTIIQIVGCFWTHPYSCMIYNSTPIHFSNISHQVIWHW